MDLGFLLGRTFRQRRYWLQILAQNIENGQVAPSYEKALKNLRKSYLWYGLLWRHIVRMYLGFAPMEMQVAVTNKCPNDCEYCYDDARSSITANDINLNLLNLVLDQARKYFKISLVIATGGEPFPLILTIAYRNPSFVFYTYTSGYIAEENAWDMALGGNIIPVLTVIDDDENHDRIRGQGSFARIMSAREILTENKIPWGFSITVSQVNLRQVIDSDLLERLNQYGPKFFRVMPYLYTGRKDNNLVLSRDDQRAVADKIRKANDNGLVVFDYVMDESNYPHCIGGGGRTFAVTPSDQDWLNVSPCIFMAKKLSAPLLLDAKGRPQLLKTLAEGLIFRQARQVARNCRCPILEHPDVWPEMIREEII